MTDSAEIARQALVEHQMLTHVEQAIRVALDWDTKGGDCSRKVSTLQFSTESFRRHLARMKNLADDDGYLRLVVDAKPQLIGAVRALQTQREELESKLDMLIARLGAVPPTDRDAVESLCIDLKAFLDELKKHHECETDLIQQAIVQEEGRSG